MDRIYIPENQKALQGGLVAANLQSQSQASSGRQHKDKNPVQFSAIFGTSEAP